MPTKPNGRHKLAALLIAPALTLGVGGGGTATAMAATEGNNQEYVSVQEVRDALSGIPNLLAETDPDESVQPALAQVDLPGVESGAEGSYRQVHPGIVAFPAKHATNAIQVTKDGGYRALTVIGDNQADESFTYKFALPKGLHLRMATNGSVNLVDDSDTIILAGFLAKPWAKDAQGKAIQTRYVISGDNRVTQVVEHKKEDVAYPIVADPQFSFSWAGRTVYFTKNETRIVSIGYAAAVGYLGAAGIGGAAAATVLGAADWAMDAGYCLAVYQPWGSPVVFPWGYRC